MRSRHSRHNLARWWSGRGSGRAGRWQNPRVRAIRVTDPSGVDWLVRVEWAPRHRALVRRVGAWRRGTRGGRKKKGASSSRWDWFPDIPADDILGPIFLALFVLLAAVLLLWWVVLPLLFLLVDALVLLVMLVLGLGVRVLLRRPWTVQATAGEHVRSVEIVGWRRAVRARDGIAAGLHTGGAAAWPALALRHWST